MIGRVLSGRYAVSKLLGRGGMGVVYLAHQAEEPHDVVIKVLSPTLRDDGEASARFAREARRLQDLQHTNIVRYLGYDDQCDPPYLVMEYVEGTPISDVLREKIRFSFAEFTPIAAQILKGVGYAHSRDVLLRDIKASNVMLCVQQGRSNFVKILDFGLAKVLEGDADITATKHVLGTPGYLAPEVLRGKEPDLRVDVYALGVLFYLMLAGQLPFTGSEPAAVYAQTVNDPVPPLSKHPIDPSIPAEFIDVIHRCLAKDPEERYPDANALMEEMIDIIPASLFRVPRAEFSSSRELVTAPSSRIDPISQVMVGPRKEPAPAASTPGRFGMVVPVASGLGLVVLAAGIAIGSGWVTGGEAPSVPEVAAASAPAPAPLGAEPPQDSVVSVRLRDAERAAARGHTEAAIEAYLDVLDHEPEHELARSGLTRVREFAAAQVRSTAIDEADVEAEVVEEAEEPIAQAEKPRSRRPRYTRTRSRPARPEPARTSAPTPQVQAQVQLPAKPAASPLLTDSSGPKKGALLPVN